jgi:hypothetical protein
MSTEAASSLASAPLPLLEDDPSMRAAVRGMLRPAGCQHVRQTRTAMTRCAGPRSGRPT